MVYGLDENNFYIGFIELTEENKNSFNYTSTQMTTRHYKPRFNHSIQDWEEGATQEEIEEMKRQEEANRPPTELNQMEVLETDISHLKTKTEFSAEDIQFLFNAITASDKEMKALKEELKNIKSSQGGTL